MPAEAPRPVVGRLEQLRGEIDVVDRLYLLTLARGRRIRRGEITTPTLDENHATRLRILGARDAVVRDVGEYKREHAIGPVDPARRDEHRQDLVAFGEEIGLSEDYVVNVYDGLHSRAVKMERATQQ